MFFTDSDFTVLLRRVICKQLASILLHKTSRITFNLYCTSTLCLREIVQIRYTSISCFHLLILQVTIIFKAPVAQWIPACRGCNCCVVSELCNYRGCLFREHIPCAAYTFYMNRFRGVVFNMLSQTGNKIVNCSRFNFGSYVPYFFKKLIARYNFIFILN